MLQATIFSDTARQLYVKKNIEGVALNEIDTIYDYGIGVEGGIFFIVRNRM